MAICPKMRNFILSTTMSPKHAGQTLLKIVVSSNSPSVPMKVRRPGDNKKTIPGRFCNSIT